MRRFSIAAWITTGFTSAILLISVPVFAESSDFTQQSSMAEPVTATSATKAVTSPGTPTKISANKPTPPPTMGFGMMLARMVFMLAAVCALAAVSLRWGLKRITHAQSGGQSIEVISRAIIEPRRAILVVRIGAKHLIVGTGEHGMTPLGELSEEEASTMKEQAQEFQDARQQTKTSFKKIFASTARAENSGKKPAFVLESSQNTENVQSL